jgi:hypothetical protein
MVRISKDPSHEDAGEWDSSEVYQNLPNLTRFCTVAHILSCPRSGIFEAQARLLCIPHAYFTAPPGKCHAAHAFDLICRCIGGSALEVVVSPSVASCLSFRRIGIPLKC